MAAPADFRLGPKLQTAGAVDAAFAECAEELIRIPGEIQPHGAMLAIDPASETVLRGSANCEAILSLKAGDLVGRRIGDAIDVEPILAQLSEARKSNRQPHAIGTVTLAHDGDRVVEVAAHAVADEYGRTETVLEFQPVVADDDMIDIAAMIGRFLATITPIESLDELLEVTAEVLRELSGYDRTMIYRFDEQQNGSVVAESIATDIEPYLGLHYPASDIPPQARQLYLEHPVRVLVDVEYDASPLLSQPTDTAGQPLAALGFHPLAPLDMSRSLLRSMSPIHRRYLSNMGVDATLAISLIRDNELWGLAVGHHGRSRRLSFRAIEAFQLVGDSLAMKINALENAESARQQEERFAIHQRILDSCQSESTLLEGLQKELPRVAAIADADGVVLWFGQDEVTRYGDTPGRDDLERIIQRLHQRVDLQDPFFSESIVADLFDAGEPPIEGPSAGMIAMQFWPSDFILLFRNEQQHSVRWAGQPVKAPSRDGDGRLQPRASFDEWIETVGNRSPAWTPHDRLAATNFRNSFAVHIVRRSMQLTELNRQLRVKTEEVERFVYSVSHDLKAPLVTCQGFLGLLRSDLADGNLEDAMDSIDRVERATTTMNTLIEDLLDFSRLGRDENESMAAVPLSEIVATVLERDRPQIEAAGLEVTVEQPLPEVIGRQQDLIRVVENLVTNTIKYACDGDDRRLHISSSTSSNEASVTFRDFGPGIPEEFHAKALRLFQRVHTKKSGSGIGLATVVKVVETGGGRVELENPEGGGLAVVLTFPRQVVPPQPVRTG